MQRSPLADRSWTKLVMGVAAMWLFLGVAVTLFTWPVARSAPRDVPVGVVASGTRATALTEQISHSRPGAYDIHVYVAANTAQAAIRRHDIYGAYVLSRHELQVITASAASSTVASMVTEQGEALARTLGVQSIVIDAVPFASGDPKGTVFGVVLLPLTVCSVTIATVIAALATKMRAWWEMVALVAVASVGAMLAYLIAQTWLGALPHQAFASWASMALMILSISATASGLTALLGTAGTAAAAVLLIFVGNSFAGSQSAPELLPDSARVMGQNLPPGAGAGLFRVVTYFDGNDWTGHVVVLICWVAVGFAALTLGHQRDARRARSSSSSTHDAATV